ncbi:MAG: hypothetical protein J6E29_06575 [Prevotella sp.]|nr:hypothetical protein [Prevotella sp.]
MIGTIGRGIRKVFTEQQKRFFTMPDYQQAKKKGIIKVIDRKYWVMAKSD